MTTSDDGGLAEDLPPEMREHLQKVASPAHVAQYCTRGLPPEAQWHPAKHLLFINRKLVDAATDTEQRFLHVAASVRHGKSLLISKWFVVWYLGMFPDRQVIIVSYSEDKAAEWGSATRDAMIEWGPELFGITVDSASSSKTEWKIKGRAGGVKAVGVNGALTGSGGDAIVVDDPLKNDREAASATERKKMRRWYDGTLRSRLMQNGLMILTMARWHEEDLAGSILNDVDEDMDQWEVVNMPAIAEPTQEEAKEPDFDEEAWRDELGRKVGDPLWPEKWPLPILHRIRATTQKRNPQVWDAQYQQNPVPAEGKMFKVENWRYVPQVDRRMLRMCRGWDLAATEGGGDWSVGLLVGMDAQNLIYILDVIRFRKDSAGVEREVKAAAVRDGKSVPIRIEQERAGAGKSTISTYSRLLVGWDVEGVKPEGIKEDRARGLSAQHINGNVAVVGQPGDEWVKLLVEEARTFPRGRHDDQVDAMVIAFEHLIDGGSTELIAEELLEVPLARMMAAGLAMQ